MPGAWVSLAFVVSAPDQPIGHELATYQLPLGWSVVVPPRPVSLAQGERHILTLAVAIPKHAPAGRHEIVVTLGQQSASAFVYVEASMSLEWVADDVTAEPQRWWPNRPWVGTASLMLTGNQPLEIFLAGRAPPGVLLNFSPKPQQIIPDAPITVTIEVHINPDHQQPLPKHLPITLDVIDAKEQLVVLSKRWVLMPLASDADPSAHRPWRLRGFLDWRSRMGEHSGWSARPSHWGIEGSGHWDQSGEQAVAFAWHKEARWGRYMGFVGKHFRWRVGHQVFVGQRLDGLSRLGRGLSARWQSDKTPDAWQVGWIQFHGQDSHGQVKDEKKHRYISPWWSWRGWRAAYIDAASAGASCVTHNGVWSLSYQTPAQSLRQHASQLDDWKAHIIGNRDNIAGRFEYRRRFTDEARWAIMAESIPNDHISDLPAGTRLRIRSHHTLAHKAWLQTGFFASHESGTVKARHRNYLWMAQYWRSVNRLSALNMDDLQLGFGATHRRGQAWIQDPYRTHPVAKQSGHRSELSIRLRGRVGTWHLSGRLDTHGRFGLASHWLQRGVGRWRLSLQNTVRKISLESVKLGPWRWSMALERHTHWALPNQGPSMVLATVNDDRAGQAKLHLNIAKRTQGGQEWSVAWVSSLSDGKDTMLWLRHRWQTNLHSPVPRIQRLVGYRRGHRIAGCARQITPEGQKPVVGALVLLNEKSTLTDRDGCYRFVGLASGPHRLAIEPSLPQAMLSGASSKTGPPTTSDWLLTTSDRVDLWLDSDSSLSVTSSLGDQNHQERTHDWSWVQAGRLVANMDWPDESPWDEASRDALLNKLRLVGICSTCPAAHQKRTAKRNGEGQWVVEQLMPGDWRWQWAGGLLPNEHELVETHRSLSVGAGQTRTLVWAMRYQPRIIDWQRTEVVELAP